MRAVASMEAVTTRLPSGEKATVCTVSAWPTRWRKRWPERAVKSMADPSAQAVATTRPSGEYATAVTSSAWPSSVRRHLPVSAHQTLARKPSDGPAKVWPSGAKAQESTSSSSSPSGAPVSAHQRLPRQPAETRSSVEPLGAKAAVRTWDPRPTKSCRPLCKWRMRAVPSRDAVRQRRGRCSNSSSSPSETPAVPRTVWLSSTCDLKRSCRATPKSPVSRSTASQTAAAVSVGLARTSIRASPLMACRTRSKTSCAWSGSSGKCGSAPSRSPPPGSLSPAPDAPLGSCSPCATSDPDEGPSSLLQSRALLATRTGSPGQAP
mmetsp:Transcript_27805/g.88377  ORF Transcript_27805/g.88377 Transcript_27805/m.88377 type:complete len:321 (-) Transcript_27805:297-1259(-)